MLLKLMVYLIELTSRVKFKNKAFFSLLLFLEIEKLKENVDGLVIQF